MRELTQEESLIENIRVAPLDDQLPRLVYADFVMEKGQTYLHDFIQLCNTKPTDPTDRKRAIATWLKTFGQEWAADAIPPLTYRMNGSLMVRQIKREMLYTNMLELSTCEFNVYNYPEWKQIEIVSPIESFLTYANSRSGIGFYGGLPTFWRGRCLDWFNERWGIGQRAIYKYPIRRVEFTDMVENGVIATREQYRVYRLDSNKLAPLTKVRRLGAIPITFSADTWDMLRGRISELAIEWAKQGTN